MPKKTARKSSGARPVKVVTAEHPRPLQEKDCIRKAGDKMRSLKAEAFPVAAGDKVVGTLEQSDPDRKVARFGHDPEAILVGENMSRKVLFCTEEQSMDEAREIMRENRLTHLPVVDKRQRIIGVVALKDLE